MWLICKWGIYLVWGTTTIYRFLAVTRFDCMMIGAIGAILFYTQSGWFNRFLSNRIIGAACLLVLFFSQTWVGFVPTPVRTLVIALLALVCIMSQLHTPIINLENRLCDLVGKISYGIYVIHPLLIFGISSLYRNADIQLQETLAAILIYYMITVVTILVAWLSYHFFESPFLRLKNRFAIVHSQNSMN